MGSGGPWLPHIPMSSQSVKPGPLSSQDWRAGSGVITKVELSRGQRRGLPPPLKKLPSSLGHVAGARKARVSAMVVLCGVPLF